MSSDGSSTPSSSGQVRKNEKLKMKKCFIIIIFFRSQSLLYNDQPGRQVDLSRVLPNNEVFWLNIEEGYFSCQVNASEKYLKLFKVSRLCDGIEDCYEASDELSHHLKCTKDCQPPCGQNGVCLHSR